MKVFLKKKSYFALGCLACAVVLLARLNNFGASEFRGGRPTGPLFQMADLGSLLFLMAMLLTFFRRRIAATIALTATLLCIPFYLYILMPGPYRWVFKGEYSVPLNGTFHWDNWAMVGIISLLISAILSLRTFSKVKADL